MKTIRRKYKSQFTTRYKNKKSKKCRQSLRQKKCKTKKIYHYRKNNKLLYQSGGEFSDDDEFSGEDPATQEDIELAIRTAEPMSPRVKGELEQLYKYRGYDSARGVRCMEYPSKNTLFGKVLEEQYAEHFFKTHFMGDTWRTMFEEYLRSPPTTEHDISPDLTNGMGAISIKSKRIGQRVGKNKTLVTIGSTCSYQICSADAVRFVNQILHGRALTLVVIYYNIESPQELLVDITRVYNIGSQLNAIWGGYTTREQRVGLVTRIEELSRLFSTAQDSPDVRQIATNIVDIKRRTKVLQVEMKKKNTLFKIAPKISSKCGEVIESCKHQCRLQAVLNVKSLSLADQLTTEPRSPTSIRGKGEGFSSFGVAKPPASARGQSASRKPPASARGQSASRKPPASARGQSGNPPASARGQSGKPPASARGQSGKPPASAAATASLVATTPQVSASAKPSARSASAKSRAAAASRASVLPIIPE